MVEQVGSRLFRLLFGEETEFAEFLMGIISVVFGIWLCTPAAHPVVNPAAVERGIPEVCGILLICTGVLKLTGVWYSYITPRAISCFLAVIVWIGTASILLNSAPPHRMTLTMATIMIIFNALIYTKLVIVREGRKKAANGS